MMSLKLEKQFFLKKSKRIKTFDEKDNYHNIFVLLLIGWLFWKCLFKHNNRKYICLPA